DIIAKCPGKPTENWDVKSMFGPFKVDARGQLGRPATKQRLSTAVREVLCGRHAKHGLDEIVVEERHASLETMRHRRPIELREHRGTQQGLDVRLTEGGDDPELRAPHRL